MIFFESYHFIAPLKVLKEKYPGGLEYFKKDVPNSTYKDDGQIATVRFLLAEEINDFVDLVTKKGLYFERQDRFSDDFTVFAMGSPWWKLKGLVSDIVYCHLDE